MKKPWIDETGGRQLEAFLGSRGMRTSEIFTTEELIQTAATVFEIPMETTCQQMAVAIARIPQAQRRVLAEKNIGSFVPQKRCARRSDNVDLISLAADLGVAPNHLRAALRKLVGRNVESH